MDAFIVAFRNLCNEIMPILGAACLVCVIILLIKTIKVLSSLDSTLLKTHVTIDLVDQSIEKVQAPLDTVVKVSGTVDRAHEATVNAVKEAREFVEKNAEEIKEKVVSFVKSDSEKDEEGKEPEIKETVISKDDELKDPDPADVVGGQDDDGQEE